MSPLWILLELRVMEL